MQIAVGSQNPIKIQAVLEAFQIVWPTINWDTVGVKIPSGVSDQPMSDLESITGARNRAKRALEHTNADYGVGLEGGLHRIENQWFDCGWVVIVDKQYNEGIGSTAKILTPQKMIDYIMQGMELGHVNDLLFKRENSKQSEGHFGLMTNNAITRHEGYKHGVIMALARFIHPELFE